LFFLYIEPGSPDDLIVTVTMSDGTTFTFGPYGDIHGNNFLMITTANNETISSVPIDSASGFHDLRQPRVSGVSGVTLIPEPSSLLLLGSGLIGVARMNLRKRSKV
jgi:PEP-CTERM motif